jgi:hypothetical protein
VTRSTLEGLDFGVNDGMATEMFATSKLATALIAFVEFEFRVFHRPACSEARRGDEVQVGHQLWAGYGSGAPQSAAAGDQSRLGTLKTHNK